MNSFVGTPKEPDAREYGVRHSWEKKFYEGGELRESKKKQLKGGKKRKKKTQKSTPRQNSLRKDKLGPSSKKK